MNRRADHFDSLIPPTSPFTSHHCPSHHPIAIRINMPAKKNRINTGPKKQFALVVGNIGAKFKHYPGVGMARVTDDGDTEEQDELNRADIFLLYSGLDHALEPGDIVEYELVQ